MTKNLLKIFIVVFILISCDDDMNKGNNLKKDFIWVYLEDLLPDQMIEYGEVLPKSGQEKKWFNSLRPSLKTRLKKMEKRK